MPITFRSDDRRSSVEIPDWFLFLTIISGASLVASLYYLDSYMMPPESRDATVLFVLISLFGVMVTVGAIAAAFIIVIWSERLSSRSSR